ncbi:hypothetical protein GCM10027517_14520 [Phycicoccus ginsengisoli]
MLAFWIVGGLGVVLLLLTFVVGDLFDGVLDGVDFTGRFLSTAAVAGFAAAFGIAGAVAMSMGAPLVLAVVVGVVAGAAMGAVGGLTTKVVSNTPTDRAPGADDLVGARGVVVSAIGDGAYGEVLVRIGGHRQKYNARSESGAIAVGSDVLVTDSLSSSSVRVRAL